MREQDEGPVPSGTGQAEREADAAVADAAVAEAPVDAAARLETLERENHELAAAAEQWKDRCARLVADMENLRRRTMRDAEDAQKYANERLLSGLLPVLDNFARALESAGQTPDPDALKAGVEQIHRQMESALAAAGLERIPAVGQPFDPNLHEAIMQVAPQDGQDSHVVVDELRAGYRLHDRVIRPTLVKVTSE